MTDILVEQCYGYTIYCAGDWQEYELVVVFDEYDNDIYVDSIEQAYEVAADFLIDQKKNEYPG